MPQQLTFRAIAPHDCQSLVALYLRSFTDYEIEASIFVSPRIENYLQQLVAFPEAQREYSLWGAWDGDDLVGYVFGRALETSWHLNFLAVAPSHRRQGLGRKLYQFWLDAGADRDYQDFTLDVAQDNSTACNWYQSLGWNVAQNTWIYRRDFETAAADLDLNNGVQASALQLRNWENAQAWQTCYGFSNFEIESRERRWKIARLGEKYFRSGELLPHEIQEFLQRLDSSRMLLLNLQQPVPHWSEWKVWLRMTHSRA